MNEFLESLPKELQGVEDLKQFENVADLAQNFIDRGKHLGNAIRIPSQEASEEDIATFRTRLMDKVPDLMPVPNLEDEDSINHVLTRLGRPDTAEAYKMVEIEGATFNKAEELTLRTQAHKMGLTNKQFAILATDLLTDRGLSTEATAKLKTDALNEIKKEWGDTFDPRKQSIIAFLHQHKAAQGIIDQVQNDDASPDLLRWFHSITTSLSEDPEHDLKDVGPDPAQITPLEAYERANEIRRRIQKQEIKQSDPMYKSYLDKLVRYDAIAKKGEIK